MFIHTIHPITFKFVRFFTSDTSGSDKKVLIQLYQIDLFVHNSKETE